MGEANFCVMNLKKVKRSDNMKGLQAEANREYEDAERYHNNVDLSRSYLNVSLIHSDDWRESIYGEIRKEGVTMDKDSVLGISAVYTASPEWFEEHPDRQEQIAYFKDCLAFHERHFGKVVSAVIHYDEDTPHMQVLSVPILEAPKMENYWICKDDGREVKPGDDRWGAPDTRRRKQKYVLDKNGKKVMTKGLHGGRALGNKRHLSHLQDEFAEQCGKPHGLERGECRVDSDEQVEHKTALQHKVEELEEREAKAQEELEDARLSYKNVSELRRNEQKKLKEACAELEKIEQEKQAVERDKAQVQADKAYYEARLNDLHEISPDESVSSEIAWMKTKKGKYGTMYDDYLHDVDEHNMKVRQAKEEHNAKVRQAEGVSPSLRRTLKGMGITDEDIDRPKKGGIVNQVVSNGNTLEAKRLGGLRKPNGPSMDL